jgi:hypothetical protein
LIQKVFNQSNSSFKALRPGPNILWEIRKKLPEMGSINYNTILQLDMFCREEGK